MEAFSDGVIAILITIMVLELHAPESADWAGLRPVLPTFLAYVLSFVIVGIYWANHHHLLQLAENVNGGILWANLHLLFWLSLVPFATAWMGEHYSASDPDGAVRSRVARRGHRIHHPAARAHSRAGAALRIGECGRT